MPLRETELGDLLALLRQTAAALQTVAGKLEEEAGRWLRAGLIDYDPRLDPAHRPPEPPAA